MTVAIGFETELVLGVNGDVISYHVRERQIESRANRDARTGDSRSEASVVSAGYYTYGPPRSGSTESQATRV